MVLALYQNFILIAYGGQEIQDISAAILLHSFPFLLDIFTFF